MTMHLFNQQIVVTDYSQKSLLAIIGYTNLIYIFHID